MVVAVAMRELSVWCSRFGSRGPAQSRSVPEENEPLVDSTPPRT